MAEGWVGSWFPEDFLQAVIPISWKGFLCSGFQKRLLDESIKQGGFSPPDGTAIYRYGGMPLGWC